MESEEQISKRIVDRFLEYVDRGKISRKDMADTISYLANKKLGAKTKSNWSRATGKVYNSNVFAKGERFDISGVDFICDE
jgi:hypothetical protein